jgi:hypothetical protein
VAWYGCSADSRPPYPNNETKSIKREGNAALSAPAKTLHTWYYRCMDRTLRVALDPTPDQAILLEERTRWLMVTFNMMAAHGIA